MGLVPSEEFLDIRHAIPVEVAEGIIGEIAEVSELPESGMPQPRESIFTDKIGRSCWATEPEAFATNH